MPMQPGTYSLGPEQATLRIRTGRKGAAAKAGHDLLIEVTAWKATIEAGGQAGATTVTLTADARSLQVREGTGGMKALGDDDRKNIHQTIDDEVLKGTAIEFASRAVRETPGGLEVDGELELFGRRHPVSFPLGVGEGGELSAATRLRQSDWGMKPYSALFGALKVADELTVELEGRLDATSN
ncbi:MAG: YceI family protein [Solirubrobacteraceae bacterium]